MLTPRRRLAKLGEDQMTEAQEDLSVEEGIDMGTYEILADSIEEDLHLQTVEKIDDISPGLVIRGWVNMCSS